MPRRDLPVGPIRSAWTGAGPGRDGDAPEHRCSTCFGPFGKSAIPCPREFPEIEERARLVAAYEASRHLGPQTCPTCELFVNHDGPHYPNTEES